MYQGLPKISENFNIPRKPLALRTWAATCLFLYLSTNSLANWLLCKCTCLWVSAVFFTPLSRVFALIEMAGVMEQRICITFCFKLNKTAPETHRMLKEAFGEQALSQARTMEWFNSFNVSGNLWKMINILVDRPHAQLRKWLRKCVKLS